MATTKTVREFFSTLSTLLNDTSPQFTRWTEHEFINYLNEGALMICTQIQDAGARVDAIRLKPGTRQSIASIEAEDIIPGDGSPAAAVSGQILRQIYRNMGADGQSPSQVITLTPREALDAQRPSWHTEVAAQVLENYVFDPVTPKFFYVYPGVPASRLWVEMSYSANPRQIPFPATPGQYLSVGSDTTMMPLDDKFTGDLINYCLSRAYTKQAPYANNPERASNSYQLFAASIESQKQKSAAG